MKTALITGASRGLGAEIARILRERGYHVITPSRDILDLSLDISISRYNPGVSSLDILINNAAIVDGSFFEVMRVNAFGPYELTLQMWSRLVAAKGRVINICSVEGELQSGSFGYRPYSVSKATLIAISKMMSRNDDGVVVEDCCPGWFRSRLGGEAAPRSAAEAAQRVLDLTLP